MGQGHSSDVAAPLGERSDTELLRLVERGDHGALGVIYDRHIEAAWTVALHCSASAAVAEQAVAAVFLSLWRRPMPDDRASLPARLLSSVSREAGGSQHPRGRRMKTNQAAHERPLMATVNEAIDRLHSSLHLADSDFFCECGHVGCKERITLTRAEYLGIHEESRPLVVAAHADRSDAAETELLELRGQVHQLEGTLASRVDIEQAKGVLVERHGLTAEEAFESLRQRARDAGVSLNQVCAEVMAETGAREVDRTSTADASRRRERNER